MFIYPTDELIFFGGVGSTTKQLICTSGKYTAITMESSIVVIDSLQLAQHFANFGAGCHAAIEAPNWEMAKIWENMSQPLMTVKKTFPKKSQTFCWAYDGLCKAMIRYLNVG